ncbi:putative ABC transporter, P-loop containing nucleoside triphosphate hydrolase [Helianthus anomalus]
MRYSSKNTLPHVSLLILSHFASLVSLAIAHVRMVYSYVGETKALDSYSDAIQHTLKLGYKVGMAKGLGLGCTYGIACMSWALVFWYAGVFIRNGQTDGSKAFTAIFSAIVGGMSLGQSFSNLGAFSKGKAVGYKLLEIIKQKPTIVQDSTDGKCLTEVNDNIEFKDVSFSYPSRPDIFIFRNFSIFFPAGKTVAVVGGSGSGKSSVVALIERFYDPNQGHILLDNVDIKTLQLKWLRDQICLVNQEPALLPPRFSKTYFTENRMQLQLKSKLQPRLPTLTASLPCFLTTADVGSWFKWRENE